LVFLPGKKKCRQEITYPFRNSKNPAGMHNTQKEIAILFRKSEKLEGIGFSFREFKKPCRDRGFL